MTPGMSIRLAFLLVCALVLAGLVLGTEYALRYVSFKGLSATDPQEIKRAIRLKELVPGYSGHLLPAMQGPDGIVAEPYKLETDEDGFVKPSNVHDKADLKIFFVGGSTTESLYVSEGNRWPFLVGRILEKETTKKVNSYNSGVSGNNVLHCLNIVLNKILPHEPRYIVLMENANDLAVLAYEQTYWNHNPYKSPIIDVESLRGPASGAKTFLRAHFPGWALALRSVSHRITPPDEFAAVRGTRISVDADKVKLQFRRSLIAFIGLARAYDVEPVLMTQFNRIENGDPVIRGYLERTLLIPLDEYVSLYKDFNEEIRKVARENKVKLIDLAREIPGTDKVIYDPFHVNDAGSKMVAEVVARKLLSFGI